MILYQVVIRTINAISTLNAKNVFEGLVATIIFIKQHVRAFE